jgi:hypothetical protein
MSLAITTDDRQVLADRWEDAATAIHALRVGMPLPSSLVADLIEDLASDGREFLKRIDQAAAAAGKE